jgi:ABC-type thiamine transport system substrate-binding protein
VDVFTNTDNQIKIAAADVATGVDNLGLERTRWADLYDPEDDNQCRDSWSHIEDAD